MTAAQLIGEIGVLPLAERRQIMSFARRLESEESLTPEELGALAEKLADCQNEAVSQQLQDEILKGFYGQD